MARLRWYFSIIGLIVILGGIFIGCSGDENSIGGGPLPSDLMLVEFRNPVEIEVDSDLQLALLLHDRTSPSGPALQLVDLDARRVLATQILDYFDVYDVEFINDNLACFAGRPQGNVGYAVYFFDLETLSRTGEVMTADTSGSHGYLDVNDDASIVYYSHAGGGSRDAIYAISTASRSLIDADIDGGPPFAFDNDLVSGMLAAPGRVFFDAASDKIIAANLGDNYITLIDLALWGAVSRDVELVYPIAGVTHISTQSGAVDNIRADAVARGDDVYAFAGISDGVSYLSRFGAASVGLDFVETFTDRDWVIRNRDVRIHPRQDVFSLFVLQQDTTGVSVGQFRLNNLAEVAGSPYRTRHIAEETIAAVGLDVINDRLIVADQESEKLEFIAIEL